MMNYSKFFHTRMKYIKPLYGKKLGIVSYKSMKRLYTINTLSNILQNHCLLFKIVEYFDGMVLAFLCYTFPNLLVVSYHGMSMSVYPFHHLKLT